MTKHRTTTGFWSRTTKALGKFWIGMLTLPDRPNHTDESGLPATLRFPHF
jgi:hypothetical protein